MLGKTHTYDLLIRESHLDTFGHVNNAKYLQIFEEARWEMITNNGYGLAEILATRRGPVILEVRVKFKKELRLRETVRIETAVTGYRKRIGTIRQRILNGEGVLAAEAEFTFGLFDTLNRKLIGPDAAWMKALGLEGVNEVDSVSKLSTRE